MFQPSSKTRFWCSGHIQACSYANEPRWQMGKKCAREHGRRNVKIRSPAVGQYTSSFSCKNLLYPMCYRRSGLLFRLSTNLMQEHINWAVRITRGTELKSKLNYPAWCAHAHHRQQAACGSGLRLGTVETKDGWNWANIFRTVWGRFGVRWGVQVWNEADNTSQHESCDSLHAHCIAYRALQLFLGSLIVFW